MSVFATRLKEARTRAGLSQEKLGVLAGIDEMSSSARMNQYERGKHEPHSSFVERLASVLAVPESFFYEKDDHVASLLVLLYRTSVEERGRIITRLLESLPASATEQRAPKR